MAFIKPFGGTLRDTIFEFVIIVIGVLVALGVDAWWQEREDRAKLQSHLLALVTEIDANLDSLKTIRDGVIPSKLTALEQVIQTLSQQQLPEIDADAFFATLAWSAKKPQLWFIRNNYDAAISAGGFRHLDDRGLETQLSDVLNAPDILLAPVAAARGDYARLVNELIPADLQSDISTMKSYVRRDFEAAPRVADPLTPNDALARVFAERERLLRLARGEVAFATGTFYGLSRMRKDFLDARARILAHPLMEGVELNAQAE